MAEAKIPADIKKLSFEAAMAELEDIVRALEDGDTSLDDAIAAYERGANLKRHCEARLQEAQLRIDRIVLAEGSKSNSDDADDIAAIALETMEID